MIYLFKLVVCTLIALTYLSSVYCEKFKLCIVDGKGGFQRSGKFCPILDQPDSKVECVLGIDRLDCLRKISKGNVDFAVFTAEDLVTAANSEVEVLLTNQLRYISTPFEYEVVAVISNSSGITSRHDLRNKRFCHPGYGQESDWTKILSNYLEASTIPSLCESKLTITENRIKASSEFFQSACKAGPWVHNPSQDVMLKNKYPNLCALCGNPETCAKGDKYWGRRGSLFCLTDGGGDIAWARLDDVNVHFGLKPGSPEADPDQYSFLCPNGPNLSLKTKNPCVWVVKPWPVIAAKRTKAQDIQEFVSALKRGASYPWQSALLSLLETYHITIDKIQPVQAIETYLDQATGFLNANSFSGCHPPRTIEICVTSIIEFAKCGWMRESAAAYGIEPNLECIKADNTSHCMQAVHLGVADIVMVPPDLLHEAKSKYHLKTLFYETVNNDKKHLIVGVTRNNSNIIKLSDAEGAKVCFPSYDGIAWNSVVASLKSKGLSNSCPFDDAIKEYFTTICAPNLPSDFKQDCKIDFGDFNAIKCLLNGDGDIAFVSNNSLKDFVYSPNSQISMNYFKVLCDDADNGCHLSWAPLGQAMVKSNRSDLWMQDTLDVFLQLDELLGKFYKTLTTPLQMFGLFDRQSNVLFHDDTVRLRNLPTTKNTDNMKKLYEDVLKNIETCSSSTNVIAPTILIMFLIILVRRI